MLLEAGEDSRSNVVLVVSSTMKLINKNTLFGLRSSPLINRARAAVASRFLIRIRRATHRMPSELRRVERCRVLLLAPHMDDEVIPCGGTLISHVLAGSDVRVVFVSDSAGPASDTDVRRAGAQTRALEMERAKEVIGYEAMETYGFPDSSLVRHEEEIAKRLIATIRAHEPDQIMCPFPADNHADHQAVALAVSKATTKCGWRGRILAYELWSAIWPNIHIDISSVVDRKEEAVRAYKSQIADRDYAAAILGLNRYRGLRHSVEFAEAFYMSGALEYSRLTLALNQL